MVSVHFFSGSALFFPQKVDNLFLVVVVTFKPTHTLNVQTSKQRGKNLAVDQGGPDGGGPFPWYNRHNG